MEWLLWAGLLLLVIGWPVLFVIVSVIRRRVLGAPTREYAIRQHAELQALEDAKDVKSGRGWY